MKKLLSFATFALITLLANVINAEPAADWTILTIMQADNNLAPFALQNINDIQKNIVGSKVNKLVYWHRPRSQQRLKYKIKPNGVIEEETLEITSVPNMEQEVIDAMRWAATKHPAKHYMLNLWNHGTGTIDHHAWGARTKNLIPYINEHSWLEVPGLGLQDERGILYSDSTKTYLNNQQLTSACKYIKENILKKNIDIVGMDACLMAMIEVAYQIKDYATYLVSSQNLEPGRGWNYGAFIKLMSSSQEKYSPLKVGQSIVDTYAQYYSGKYSFYTLSVIDLTEINELKKNLDTIVGNVFRCHSADIQGIFPLIKQAALASVKFDGAEFIDLHSFYANVVKSIKTRANDRKKKSYLTRITPEQEKILVTLQESLEAGMNLVTKTVKANKVGSNFNNAKGISIYFPAGNFHPSYARTLFAIETSWAYLVQAANLQRIDNKSMNI